jgi:hypothetical protein
VRRRRKGGLFGQNNPTNPREVVDERGDKGQILYVTLEADEPLAA